MKTTIVDATFGSTSLGQTTAGARVGPLPVHGVKLDRGWVDRYFDRRPAGRCMSAHALRDGRRSKRTHATTVRPAAAGTSPTYAKPGPSATMPPASGPSR